MILSCHHISKAFPEGQVLSDITFHLEKGDRAAVVGVNGAGKSTLLKIIIGQMDADEGQVAFARETTYGYLAQNQDLDSDSTIEGELLTVRQDVIDMEKKLALDEEMMGKVYGSELDALMTEYNELLARFKDANGYAYRGEITGVLRGLGFAEPEFQQKIRTLSGGQKTRVALAKLLLKKPDLLFLDEPTNHLDIGSIRWLETYLSNYRGTVLVVSHDRYFLDKCVTKIIEIENAHATVFNGNYSFYAEHKKALREQQWHQYLNNQAEIRHQEEVIAKLRQFNREKSIKRAQSREKALSKMDRLEKPFELRDDMHLTFRPCIKSGNDVCEVRHLKKSFDNRLLFADLSFDIHRGEHIAIIGNNGTGKSTLLKILLNLAIAQGSSEASLPGIVAPDEGSVHFGTNVHIGYYDQEHHVLHDDRTVFEEISDAYPDMTNTEIRGLLASFLFTGEEVFKQVGALSGGEKGRLSLSKLMLSEANFLILDEPTNHLDMTSKEVLENALNSYEGTVLYVSHDRYFINHTASRILSLTDQLLLDYPGNNAQEAPERFTGNYDFYLEKQPQVESALIEKELRRIEQEAGPERLRELELVQRHSATQQAPAESGAADGDFAAPDSAGTSSIAGAFPASGTSSGDPRVRTDSGNATSSASDWQQQKQQQAKARKLAGELKKTEDRIAQLEARNTALDEEMALPENCTDIGRLSTLQKEKSANEEELTVLYDQWEQLQS